MVGLALAALSIAGQAKTVALDAQQALYRAIASVDEKAIRKALEDGASLRDSASDTRVPPIFYALSWPQAFDVLRRLGAPLDATDHDGRTLLHHLGSYPGVLSAYRPDAPVFLNEGVFHLRGSRQWRRDVGADMIRSGLNINTRDKQGKTALHYAVLSDWKGVELLLEIARPDVWMTPGRFIRTGDLEKRRIDVDIQDADGSTPLILFAKERSSVSLESRAIIAGLLLEAGADLSLHDRSNRTAEDWAARNHDLVLMALLKAKRESPVSP